MKPKCPKCGEIIDAATCSDGSNVLPSRGDVSICLYCDNVMIFDGPIQLPRAPTHAEQMKILSDPDIMSTLIAIAFNKRKTLQ